MRQGRFKALRLGALVGLILLAACSSTPPGGEGVYKVGRPYQIGGRWYYPAYDPDYDRTGIASWYGSEFHGQRTANGEVFDRTRLSAAHPTLPLPSVVRVTNLANRRALEVRVNDRGPFADDRIIDLSQAAARALGFEQTGTAPVRVQFVSLAPARGTVPEPARVATSKPSASPVHAAPVLASAASPHACARGEFIQVGAFAELERAMQLARALDALKLAPVRTEPPGADAYARVRLGPLADARAVGATLYQLQKFGFANAFLVKPQQLSWQSC